MTPRLLPALLLAFVASCRLFAPGAEDLPKSRGLPDAVDTATRPDAPEKSSAAGETPAKPAAAEKGERPGKLAKADRGDRAGRSDGPIRVYFTRPGPDATAPGNIADQCSKYIDDAQHSLDVAAFELDNVVITDALVRAARRGVKVRLVTDTDYIDEHGVKALREAGVPVIDDKRNALMHCKFIVFDDAAVWTGSMNFTENCAYKNDNHGVYISDRRMAENFAAKFRWMFEQHKFGGAPPGEKTPYPVLTLKDGTEVDTYFSSSDKPAVPLKKEIDATKKTLHFLAFSFTHKDLGAAVVKAHDAGVQVSGVFETSQGKSQYSMYHTLKNNGIDVAYDGNSRNMHHKVMIFDGERVACGSFNFSSSANDSNDENMLIVRNRDVAGQFETEFRRVRGLAK